jgi:hypothetical protein
MERGFAAEHGVLEDATNSLPATARIATETATERLRTELASATVKSSFSLQGSANADTRHSQR